MLKNWKAAAAAVALSGAMFGAGAAYTSSVHAQIVAPAQTVPALRGERGSARNIIGVRRRLEALIDQLQRDRRDYGGHREQAIDLMQQARYQLDLAIQWDATHPGQ